MHKLKKYASSVATAVALLLLLSASVTAQVTPEWSTKFDSTIEKGISDNHMPGLAIGIVMNGKLVYSRGFGQATLGTDGPKITPDTVFHMASITKPFVATAIMQLVEQGKVNLDDPITKYLPYFRLDDKRYTTLTIKQFVTHTSGMPDVDDYEWDKPQYDDAALERYVRSLKSEKLIFDPGSRWAYSNMAFEVLADVISKASGQSFEDYVSQHILIPVGMTHSTLLKEKTDPKTLASGYTKGKDGLPVEIKAYPYNRPHNASSDLMSSVNDMARWAVANMNRGEIDGNWILKASTYDLMWKPYAEVEFCNGSQPCRKPGTSVGISWFLENKDGRFIVSHGGGDDGFITQLVMVPDRKFALVMMTNTDAPNAPFLKDLMQQALSLTK
ncbi:MAG TPA: serine hydrolase domain-containing protein [Pyrinomonadaceae bacterium]|jgi:CubicO group peptidase (beta-lactamase class C family)